MIRQALPTICKRERQGATADGPAARLGEYILVDYRSGVEQAWPVTLPPGLSEMRGSRRLRRGAHGAGEVPPRRQHQSAFPIAASTFFSTD